MLATSSLWAGAEAKFGMPPPNPERYAPYTLAINLIGGGVIVFVILGIVTGSMDFDTWTASAGVTIWMKFFLDFALGRHAHPIVPRRKKVEQGKPSAEH